MHGRGGEVGEQLRLDLQEVSTERVPACHTLTGQPPVAGFVLPERQQVCVVELHFPTRLRAPADPALPRRSSLVASSSLLSPDGIAPFGSRESKEPTLGLVLSLGWS